MRWVHYLYVRFRGEICMCVSEANVRQPSSIDRGHIKNRKDPPVILKSTAGKLMPSRDQALSWPNTDGTGNGETNEHNIPVGPGVSENQYWRHLPSMKFIMTSSEHISEHLIAPAPSLMKLLARFAIVTVISQYACFKI